MSYKSVALGWICSFYWPFNCLGEYILCSKFPLSLSHLCLSLALPISCCPPNEKWRQRNLLYRPASLPSPQQQQIKSEQRWTNRQKFTPLSLSISVSVDNNPDLCFPSCFHSQSPSASCPLQENKVSLWLLLTAESAHSSVLLSVLQSSAMSTALACSKKLEYMPRRIFTDPWSKEVWV